jgi:hypothetical protein
MAQKLYNTKIVFVNMTEIVVNNMISTSEYEIHFIMNLHNEIMIW